MDGKRLAEIEERLSHGCARVQDTAELIAEVRRLQTILDNRPAINAGLPETYIEWSQGIYVTDMAHGAKLYQS